MELFIVSNGYEVLTVVSVRSKGCVIVLFRNLRYLIKWVLIGLIVLVYRSIYLLVFCLGITLITVVT